jgi:hypothetical protein
MWWLRARAAQEWTGAAADEGEAAAEWFSSFLGQPARLVRRCCVRRKQPDTAHSARMDSWKLSCSGACYPAETEAEQNSPLLSAHELAGLQPRSGPALPLHTPTPSSSHACVTSSRNTCSR